MIKFILILIFTLIFTTQVNAGYDNLNNLINNQRPYKLISSSKLDQIALCRAKYVLEDHWTHNGHKICFKRYGLTYNYGEILAKGYYSDNDIVNAWLNSSSHNRVMKQNWKYIGSSKWGDITVVVFN